jgi:signal transduction histidine kinase/CheY-like chemotaxis protein
MLYIIILFIIIGLGFNVYKTFEKYKEYQKIEDKREQQVLFNQVDMLFKALEKEQFYSMIFLAQKNKYANEDLIQLQKYTDRIMRRTLKKLEIDVAQKLSKNLKNIRIELKSSKADYLTILVDGYQKNIIKPILTELNKFANSNCKINELMLIRLENSINLENSFLAYTLLTFHKMQAKDLEFWNSILANRILPNFISSKEDKIFVKLHSILDVDTFNKIGAKERVQLFLDSKTGEYKLSIGQWLDIIGIKLKKLDEAEKILVYNDKIVLDNERLYKEHEMNNLIFIFLLLMILLGLFILVLYFIKKMNRDRYFLKNTLREIEVEVDDDKKRELEALIRRNDSIEIYKFLANAIKEPSRAKDLFLANMSHEIRTPLNGIVGFTKELQQTELNEEQKEMLDIIEESSNHLIHIVNDILDFSKIKAGKVELESIRFNPILKFEASIDTFIAQSREKNIDLKVYIDPRLPLQLWGDPTKILQILNNLISNAIKFTVEGGLVEISIVCLAESEDEVEVKISVKDSGIGVNPEERKRIFDEFSQADASTSRQYGGTGLGLSISSQFVKFMGGVLELESKVGEGSIFYFSLKLKKTIPSRMHKRLNLQHCMVGYLPPKNHRGVDEYLKMYTQYQGLSFKSYIVDELLSLDKNSLPDLLMIDYRCFDKEGELEPFLGLPIKIVLIVADNREEELTEVRDKIDYILHKPVNYTRTFKALSVLNQVENQNHSKVITPKFSYGRKKALVAEDNFINQKLMKSILNRLGIEVEIVSNGEEALSKRVQGDFDIIFMDVQMPIMGGVEATKKILEFEENEGLRHIPIVALTANALEGDREKYLALGMDEYLAKPMKIDELESILKEKL